MSTRFFEKNEFTEDDLNNLIRDKIEESINLDYKAAGALADNKIKEISKDVSAFANSDGGVIIYGIEEQNHVPKSFSFIDGNKITKEWLENKIDGNIQQNIEGLLIHPIRIDGKLEQTVFIVQIPMSSDAPHINGDKKYYCRHNFKSVPMEEYQVRNLYQRQSLTHMTLHSIFCARNPSPNMEIVRLNRLEFQMQISVKNIGQAIEKNCKIECVFDTDSITSVHAYNNKSFVNTRKTTEAISVSNHSEYPIFPNEEVCILDISIVMQDTVWRKLTDEYQFELIMYSSNSAEKIYIKWTELVNRHTLMRFSDE